MGRQKIPMEKIKSECALQVSFSKRRFGAFKKANELATLCGALVALIVFSPSGRPYSIGFPSVETVLDIFLMRSLPSEVHMRGGTLLTRELNNQLMEVRSHYEQEYGRKVPLDAMVKQSSEKINLRHTGRAFEGNTLYRLELLEEQMLELKHRLVERIAALDAEDAAAALQNQLAPLPTNQLYPYMEFDELSQFQTQPLIHSQMQMPVQIQMQMQMQMPVQMQMQMQQMQLLQQLQHQQQMHEQQQMQLQQQPHQQPQQQQMQQPQQQQMQQQMQQQQQIQDPNLLPLQNLNLNQTQYQQYKQCQNPGGELANMDSLEYAINTNFFGRSSNEAGPSNVAPAPPASTSTTDLVPLPDAANYENYLADILLNDEEMEPINTDHEVRQYEDLLALPDAPNLESYFSDLLNGDDDEPASWLDFQADAPPQDQGGNHDNVHGYEYLEPDDNHY